MTFLKKISSAFCQQKRRGVHNRTVPTIEPLTLINLAITQTSVLLRTRDNKARAQLQQKARVRMKIPCVRFSSRAPNETLTRSSYNQTPSTLNCRRQESTQRYFQLISSPNQVKANRFWTQAHPCICVAAVAT